MKIFFISLKNNVILVAWFGESLAYLCFAQGYTLKVKKRSILSFGGLDAYTHSLMTEYPYIFVQIILLISY